MVGGLYTGNYPLPAHHRNCKRYNPPGEYVLQHTLYRRNTMDLTTYGQRRHKLQSDATSQIEEIETTTANMQRPSGREHITRLIFFGVIILNLVYVAVQPGYAIYWVVSSFILLMVNPFILMLPTEKGSLVFPDTKKKADFHKLLHEAALSAGTIKRERVSYAQAVWDLFFMNCQPIAPGFIILFVANMILAATGAFLTGGFEQRSGIIIIVQSLAIIAFYGGILYVRPYSPGFFNSMIGVKTDLSRKIHTNWQDAFKLILIVAFGAAFTGVIFLGALLFPGRTLVNIMELENFVLATSLVPLFLIFISQLVILRYFQGRYSRTLLLRMSEYWKQFLEEKIVANVQNLPPEPEPDSERDLESLEKAFIRINMFKIDYQDFAGLFPVWMIVPNMDVLITREKKEE